MGNFILFRLSLYSVCLIPGVYFVALRCTFSMAMIILFCRGSMQNLHILYNGTNVILFICRYVRLIIIAIFVAFT